MTTIQMTLDESLLNDVDRAVKRLQTTRSAFIRQSLRRHLKELNRQQLDAKDRAGYAKHPVKRSEFDVWYKEQRWSD